jgi:hypothetical protein
VTPDVPSQVAEPNGGNREKVVIDAIENQVSVEPEQWGLTSLGRTVHFPGLSDLTEAVSPRRGWSKDLAQLEDQVGLKVVSAVQVVEG